MIDMDASVDYTAGFTYSILILYASICISASMVTQNRQYLMDGLPIFSLNMYKCTYNPDVASTHCVQQLCEISV